MSSPFDIDFLRGKGKFAGLPATTYGVDDETGQPRRRRSDAATSSVLLTVQRSVRVS